MFSRRIWRDKNGYITAPYTAQASDWSLGAWSLASFSSLFLTTAVLSQPLPAMSFGAPSFAFGSAVSATGSAFSDAFESCMFRSLPYSYRQILLNVPSRRHILVMVRSSSTVSGGGFCCGTELGGVRLRRGGRGWGRGWGRRGGIQAEKIRS